MSNNKQLIVKTKTPPGGWGDYVQIKNHISLKATTLNACRDYCISINALLEWEPNAPKKKSSKEKNGIYINRAGPGVSGEVTAIYWKPNSDKGIYLQISPDLLNQYGILYRVCTRQDIYGCHSINTWAVKATAVGELVSKIKQLVENKHND